MAVLYCGHSICRKCLTTMCENYNELNIKCPICRNEMTLDSICYVRRYQEEGIEIKGSFSTKIRSVTKKLMELIIQEPKVKVLIFSCVSIYNTIFNFKYARCFHKHFIL